jgi:hypothetical protein
MSHVTPKPDHRKLPRKKRTPSARDQAILVAYRTQGCTQASLAKEHHISQRRVSEIVRRVERWRANLIPDQESELDHEQRVRLDRWLERERGQAIFDRAIRAFDNARPELKTTRAGHRDGKPFEETTVRQVEPSAQHLRLASQANRDLSRLADKPAPKEARRSQEEEEQYRYRIMKDELYKLRRQAELEGKVIQDDYKQEYFDVVNWVVDVLAGKRPESYDDILPGTPIYEVSTLIAPQQVQSPKSNVQSQEDSTADSTLDLGPGTLDSSPDLGPETLDPSFNCSTDSNPLSVASSQPQSPPHVPIPNPKSQIPNAPAPPANDMREKIRRYEEWRRLKRSRGAQTSGRQHSDFLPADDRPPPRLEYRLDGCGWKPTPPNKEEEAALVKAYLEQLRAQEEAKQQAAKRRANSGV